MSEEGFFSRMWNSIVIFWRSARESRVGSVVLNKYFIFGLFILIYLCFITKNNVFAYLKARSDISSLQREKMMYRERIISSEKRIEELKSNKDSLEKFAREQYLFLEDGEEVYVVSK